jgi:pSer/pThr/pTyr-binding forkhead associated (FHA) protein
LTVGRDVSNDLVINDAEVSRNHARLTAQSGGYLIEDLASTNGTFVIGQRLIGPKLLNPGDVIGLGETVVLEYDQQIDAGATVIAPPRVAEELATTPPRAPEPEPEPPPTIAEPMVERPPEPVPPPVTAPPPITAPPPAPRRDNRNLYLGLGCGCLTLCLCAAVVAGVVNYWPLIMETFGF